MPILSPSLPVILSVAKNLIPLRVDSAKNLATLTMDPAQEIDSSLALRVTFELIIEAM